jgi:hypothetical protein
LKEDKEKKSGNEEKTQSGEITRRDFLVGAGTVVVGGAIGAGILSGCNGGEATTKTVEVTKTVEKTTTVGGSGAVTVTETKTVAGEGGSTVTATTTVTEGGSVSPSLEPEGTYIGTLQNLTEIDVKHGRIIRTRALHYDSRQPDIQPWSITARGKTWTVPTKNPLSPLHITTVKESIPPEEYCILFKGFDWEPGGDPDKINAQNRGTSKYKRISWDEASSLIASELKRVAEKYGTAGITKVSSGSQTTGGFIQGRQNSSGHSWITGRMPHMAPMLPIPIVRPNRMPEAR